MNELTQLPMGFYIAIGVLIVSNIGTVGALIVFIFKCGMFVAETKSGIEKSTASANRAHARLTEHERAEHGKSI